MRTFSRTIPKLVGAYLSLSLLQPVDISAQGSLTPPGAPGPTMKTLDQLHDQLTSIESTQDKRVVLSSLPVTIIRSGSYILAGSATFSATSGDAITVTVSNVTIDLNGNTLASTAAVSGDGIHINGNLRNVIVRNGAIAGTTTVSISGVAPSRTWNSAPGGFAHAIYSDSSTVGCEFSHLRISGSRFSGLVADGNGTVIDGVTAVHNGDKGIESQSCSVANSSATLNHGQGILASAGTATNCSAADNGEDGIVAHSVSNSTAFTNGESGIAGNIVTNCSSSGNGLQGFNISDGSVTNCTARSNGTDGILAPNGVVAFCRASNNNAKGNGSVNINAVGATRTGNSPTP